MPEKQLTTADDVADMAEFLMTPKADTLYGNIIHASRAVRR
jgi:enoyl-[acyl-carrier-protein] reductase (NADH)